MTIADRHIAWTPAHRADVDAPASDAERTWQAALARTPDRDATFSTMSGDDVPRLSTPRSADIDYDR